jgi:hypothetical protein
MKLTIISELNSRPKALVTVRLVMVIKLSSEKLLLLNPHCARGKVLSIGILFIGGVAIKVVVKTRPKALKLGNQAPRV